MSDATSEAPTRRWMTPEILFLTIPLLVGASGFWYTFRFHRDPHLKMLQPVFMVVGSMVFLGLVRIFSGLRWRDLSRQTRIVIVTSIGLFSVLWLVGRSGFFYDHLTDVFPKSVYSALYPWFYFVSNCILLRTIVPLLLIVLVLKRRPVDFGYRLRGTFELSWIYALLAGVVILVVVFYASTLPTFQAKYPMARAMISRRGIPLTTFIAYQLSYGLVFVSGESFWRGYIVFGVERDLSLDGLLFMLIPYSMAHYGKPFVETQGALLTGLVLGYLALRHRSFWLGVAAHWAVAMTMDFSAVWRRGIDLF